MYACYGEQPSHWSLDTRIPGRKCHITKDHMIVHMWTKDTDNRTQNENKLAASN